MAIHGIPVICTGEITIADSMAGTHFAFSSNPLLRVFCPQ
jgi:hypothetical protein